MRQNSSSGSWNSLWARNVPTNFDLQFNFHVILGICYIPQICDMGQTALIPLRRKAYWGLFALKNPTASAGFQLANYGTHGQHANSWTTERVTVWQAAGAVHTVVYSPDDGWKYHPKHLEQFPDINKLFNAVSCWIYIGILLGAQYIFHISRIRVIYTGTI